MTKEEMIKEIYEAMADKTLKHGCKIEVNWSYWILYSISGYWTYEVEFEKRHEYVDEFKFKEETNIIWNPVMLWNVINWLNKNCHVSVSEEEFKNIIYELIQQRCFEYWDMLNPIDEQTEDCIKYVHSLIK